MAQNYARILREPRGYFDQAPVPGQEHEEPWPPPGVLQEEGPIADEPA